jgi:histone H3/H4
MMYSSEDDYQSPAVIRRFGAKGAESDDKAALPEKRRRKTSKADIVAAAAAAIAEEEEEERPRKRQRLTFSQLDLASGLVANKAQDLTEFRVIHIRDTLNLIAAAAHMDILKFNVVTKGSDGKSKTIQKELRWSMPAITAIASILAMKVRRLLEAAVDTMDEKSVTLSDKAISKAMKILGESHALRGKEGYDANLTRMMLEEARYDPDKRGSKKTPLTSSEKAELLAEIKTTKETEWKAEINKPHSPLLRAYDMFAPSTLNILFKETGIQRANREDIRRILAHYALNILANIVMRIHPILLYAKRSTVTLKDIEMSKDDTDRTALLGFSSMVKKRPNPERSKIAHSVWERYSQAAPAAAVATGPIIVPPPIIAAP